MEIVAILRVLRRHRLLVIAGIPPAVLLALAIHRHATPHTSGLATGRAFVAARNEPTADLGTDLTDSLGIRSLLIADRLAADDWRAQVAQAARIAPSQVAIIAPPMGSPPLQIPLAVAATQAAGAAPERYVVTLTADGEIPIISITVTGPDAGGAVRVADAAIATLQRVSATAFGHNAHNERVLVEPLGLVSARRVVDAPSAMVAVAAGLFVLIAWCSGIVLLSGVARWWRRGRRRDAAPYRSVQRVSS